MTQNYQPSTRVSKNFVRHVLGFGVGVGLGLAPFLGKLKVPGFAALLEFFPSNLQGVAIPVSSFLMGCIATGVQFFSSERISKRSLSRIFVTTFAAMIVFLIAMIFWHFLYVVTIPFQGEKARISTVIGGAGRLSTCGCEQQASDKQCIRELSFLPGAVESCWGSSPVRINELILVLLYLATTACFGTLIGLIMIKDIVNEVTLERRVAGGRPKKKR
jgi:hypothetical protein